MKTTPVTPSTSSPQKSTDLKMETPGAVAAQLLKSKGISVPPCLESNTDPINTLQTVEAHLQKQFPMAVSLFKARVNVQPADSTIGSPEDEEHRTGLTALTRISTSDDQQAEDPKSPNTQKLTEELLALGEDSELVVILTNVIGKVSDEFLELVLRQLPPDGLEAVKKAVEALEKNINTQKKMNAEIQQQLLLDIATKVFEVMGRDMDEFIDLKELIKFSEGITGEKVLNALFALVREDSGYKDRSIQEVMQEACDNTNLNELTKSIKQAIKAKVAELEEQKEEEEKEKKAIVDEIKKEEKKEKAEKQKMLAGIVSIMRITPAESFKIELSTLAVNAISTYASRNKTAGQSDIEVEVDILRKFQINIREFVILVCKAYKKAMVSTKQKG